MSTAAESRARACLFLLSLCSGTGLPTSLKQWASAVYQGTECGMRETTETGKKKKIKSPTKHWKWKKKNRRVCTINILIIPSGCFVQGKIHFLSALNILVEARRTVRDNSFLWYKGQLSQKRISLFLVCFLSQGIWGDNPSMPGPSGAKPCFHLAGNIKRLHRAHSIELIASRREIKRWRLPPSKQWAKAFTVALYISCIW